MRLLILYLFILQLSSCITIEEVEPKTLVELIPTELKSYFEFKPGSYWIYEDSITGALDTVTVTDLYQKLDTSHNLYHKNSFIYEYLGLYTYSSLEDTENNYYIDTRFNQNDPERIKIVRSKSNTTTSASNYCFVYPIFIGSNLILSYGVSEDTCKINNIIYNYYGFPKVIMISQNLNTCEDDRRSITYYAENIGVVRLEVPQLNKYRKLISYNLNP